MLRQVVRPHPSPYSLLLRRRRGGHRVFLQEGHQSLPRPQSPGSLPPCTGSGYRPLHSVHSLLDALRRSPWLDHQQAHDVAV